MGQLGRQWYFSIPKVSRRKELYKRCVRIGMKTREVGMELVTMEDAGLVILDGDKVLCGEEPPNNASGDGSVAIPSSTLRGPHGTAITTPTTAAPTAGTTHGINNSSGKKRMDAAGATPHTVLAALSTGW